MSERHPWLADHVVHDTCHQSAGLAILKAAIIQAMWANSGWLTT